MQTYSAFVIFFLCFVIVAFIVLIILRFTRTETVTKTLNPDLQQVFDSMGSQTDSIDLQKNPGKPFRIMSDSKEETSTDVYTFDNSTSLVFPAQRYVGFRFRTVIPIRITALEFIATSSPVNTTHIVAIYNLQTGLELTSPSDRTVNRSTDSLDEHGFVVHFLAQAINIPANTPIAIVAQVNTDDRYLQFQPTVQVDNRISVEGGIATTGSTLTLPTVFTAGIVQYFVAFQFQPSTVQQQAPKSVFDVSLVTTFARYPPKYVRNMTVSVPPDGINVIIDKGFALSQNNEANINLSLAVTLTSANGVNGLDTGVLQGGTWYNVFVIGSSTDGTIPTAGLISLGRLQPTLLPFGYDVFRRVGTVYATSGTTWESSVQEGDANSRTTSYTGDIFSHRFTGAQGGTTGYVASGPINFLPPTATQATIAVRGQMIGDVPPFLTPVNVLIRFRPRFALDEGVNTIGVADSASTFDQITLPLTAIPLQHEIEFRIFLKELTFYPLIPNHVVPPNFATDYYITSYFETI